jgi:hypothetical protein
MENKFCHSCGLLLIDGAAADRGEGLKECYPGTRPGLLGTYCRRCGAKVKLTKGEAIHYNLVAQRPVHYGLTVGVFILMLIVLLILAQGVWERAQTG